jgi:hypothetical protein
MGPDVFLLKRTIGSLVVAAGTLAFFANWSTVPGGCTIDALSNVLNALCIAQTRAEEYIRFLPTDIRVFNDHRPPLLIYLLGLSSFLHPLTVETARFIGMCLGWSGLGLLFLFRSHFPLPPISHGFFHPLLFVTLLCSFWVLVPHRMPVEFVTTLPAVFVLLLTCWKWIQRPQSHAWAAMAAGATSPHDVRLLRYQDPGIHTAAVDAWPCNYSIIGVYRVPCRPIW